MNMKGISSTGGFAFNELDKLFGDLYLYHTGYLVSPDSEEFKKRYIENPEWKKTKLRDEIKELQSREKSHRDMAQYYTRVAEGVADDIKNKEKELDKL
jgi:hypothetical protein